MKYDNLENVKIEDILNDSTFGSICKIEPAKEVYSHEAL